MKHLTILLGALLQFALVQAASASPVNLTFGDSVYNWQGWTNTTSWSGGTDNSSDVIGDPNITGGMATVNGSRLASVSFNYYAPYNTWQMLSPGMLFIDRNADSFWDYVVAATAVATTSNTNQSGTNSPVPNGDYNVYDISARNISAVKPTNFSASSTPYILSGRDNTTPWQGYLIRDNHPIGIKADVLAASTLLGLAHYSGFPGVTTGNNGYSSYDFTGIGGGLSLDRSFIIGWEMTCANDVLYETLNVPLIPNSQQPVPEPGTVVLLGVGLLGLAGFGKKFRR